jgi:hypothetical protein
VFLDTEFIEDGGRIDLVSIGLAFEDSPGPEYYAESSEANLDRATPWHREHVLPHLLGGAHRATRRKIRDELVGAMGPNPEIWAYYGASDWVALYQLFGTMMDLPEHWPRHCMDVKQYAVMLGNPKLPPKPPGFHRADTDAVWCRDAWKFLDLRPDNRLAIGHGEYPSFDRVDVRELREGGEDGGDLMGYWCKGHVGRDLFARAANHYSGAHEQYDARHVRAEKTSHAWWRAVPEGPSTSMVFYREAEPHSRGAFPVTFCASVSDKSLLRAQRELQEHSLARSSGFAEGVGWAVQRAPADGGEILRLYKEDRYR